MSIFSWLRTRTRDAVLAGVNDALDHLNALPAVQPAEPILLRLDGTHDEDVPEGTTNGRQRQTARGR